MERKSRPLRPHRGGCAAAGPAQPLPLVCVQLTPCAAGDESAALRGTAPRALTFKRVVPSPPRPAHGCGVCRGTKPREAGGAAGGAPRPQQPHPPSPKTTLLTSVMRFCRPRQSCGWARNSAWGEKNTTCRNRRGKVKENIFKEIAFGNRMLKLI